MKGKNKTVQGRRRKSPPRCDRCRHYDCASGKDCFGRGPEFLKRYEENQELTQLANAAAAVEAEYYGMATRLEEICHFARAMGFTHLGVAFCTGFKEEARIVCDLLRNFFRVSSVCCKNCAVPKKALGLPHLRGEEHESMCNPLGQAELLNRAGVDLNVVLGLCVGHDAIFNRQAEAPVTTLVVKDRALAHNPVGAIYCPYVRRRLEERLSVDDA
jgi:uncharacterized metal-binding protein